MARVYDYGMALARRRDLLRRRRLAWRTIGLLGGLMCVWALTSAAKAQAPALTTVQDSAYLGTGTVTVVLNHDMTTPDGKYVPQGQEWTVTLSGGAFTVALPPNVGSLPSNTSYTAYYNVTPGGQYSRTWIVPASGTPVGLATVQTAGPAPVPTVMFPLSQITPPSACASELVGESASGLNWQCYAALVNPMTTAGDLIVGGAGGSAGRLGAGTAGFVLTSTGPGSQPNWQAAAAAGVASFNGRTGTVVPAANDYTFAQLAGSLTATQVAAAGMLSNGITGNAATATALATTPTQCPSTQIVTGVTAAGDANCQDPLVSGPTANGAAPAAGSNPVFVGGWDGTNVRSLLTDTSGHAVVNINGTVPVSGTFWQATQPVSIASLPALPIGSNTIGAVTGSGTFTVAGTVTSNIGATNGLALDATVSGTQVAQGSTTSGQHGALMQGAVTTASPIYTTAQTSPLSLTVAGALRTDASATTQPVSGTVTANQGTANATPWPVEPQPTSTAAQAPTAYTTTNLTSAATIDSSAGNLFHYEATNSGTAACYVEFFNAVSGSVSLGTTAPIWTVPLLATSTNGYSRNSAPTVGGLFSFGTALSAAAVTTAGGSTTCPANVITLNAGYK